MSWTDNCCMPKEAYSAINDSIPLISALCRGLVNALTYYNKTNYAKAYKLFGKSIDSIRAFLFDTTIMTDRTSKINSYYRIRTGEKVFSSRKDLFHIPLSARDKIKSYRYSIAGFPCLYLSTDIELCWFECGMPKHFSYSYYTFDNSADGKKLIDFAEDAFSIVNCLDILSYEIEKDEAVKRTVIETVQKYIITLPLKAACSFSVKNKDSAFIEEYILPQMLLLWMKEKTDYAGILYRTRSAIENAHDWNCINLVMPAREINADYCSFLNSTLLMTKPMHVDLQKEVSKQSDKRKKVEEFIDYVETQSFEERSALYPYRQFLSIAKSFILQYDALAEDNYSNAEALYLSFLTLNRTVELIRDQYAGIKQEAIEDVKRLNPFVDEDHIKERVERQIKQFETCVVPAIQSFNNYASFALGTNDFKPTDLKHPLEN